MTTLKQLLQEGYKVNLQSQTNEFCNNLTYLTLTKVKEWLTENLKDNECCAECDIINRFIKTELLGELK